MLINNVLLKIETGQELKESQEKKLAKYLMLAPSLLRMVIYVILLVSTVLFSYIGFIGGYDPISKEVAFISVVILVLLIFIMSVVPRIYRMRKYISTIDKYYETAFKDYKNFDLYYIDQHVSPYIKPLSTKKLYLLTDGYHFLFMSDPFKDTIYKMPKYLLVGKSSNRLRVINKDINEYSKIMVRLEDVEQFYISSNNFPKDNENKNKKISKQVKYFFDQTSNYIDSCIVVLKLKSGVILRLSHDVYPVFKNLMPHKEKANDI